MPSTKLEKYKIFPYIAWTTVILFAMFVFNIALTLQKTANSLSETSSKLEAKISQNVMDVQFNSTTTAHK